MNNKLGYFLIIIGGLWLAKELHAPYVNYFLSWEGILIGIGLYFLIDALTAKKHKNFLAALIPLGLGIHFIGLKIYPAWPDHWSIYTLIIGISLLIQGAYERSKSAIITAVLLLAFSHIAYHYPTWLTQLETLWPLGLIIFGIYLIFKRR